MVPGRGAPFPCRTQGLRGAIGRALQGILGRRRKAEPIRDRLSREARDLQDASRESSIGTSNRLPQGPLMQIFA
jgi:hypothetical protein